MSSICNTSGRDPYSYAVDQYDVYEVSSMEMNNGATWVGMISLSIYVSIYLSMCLCVYLSFMSIYLPNYLFIYLYMYLFTGTKDHSKWANAAWNGYLSI
jgi:hypothetical protein